MRQLLDTLKCVLGLLLRVTGIAVGRAGGVARKAAQAAKGALRWVASAILGEHVSRARWSLALLFAPASDISEPSREPGKAGRLFQLIGWRLHGGGPRSEAHVEAA